LKAAWGHNSNRRHVPAEAINGGRPALSYHRSDMSSPQTSLLLSFEDARRVVEEHSARLHASGKELLGLLDCQGRVLAEDIAADRELPPFARATRDGYAIRTADLAEIPARLRMSGEVRAGAKIEDMPEVQAGDAVAIMTGAPVPAGADAVVMVEYTERQGVEIGVSRKVAPGENIVSTGAEARRGQRLLSTGSKLDAAAIALAASVGRNRVLVYRKPKIAILATGDELVDVDVQPGPHQIRNSNSYSLAAQVQAAGGEPVVLPIARDELQRLKDLIAEGFESDLLLISGGVSVGKYDLVEQALAGFDCKFLFTGAQIQPGKPIVFGLTERAKYFFGLPGNPVSTLVTFQLFVEPVIYSLAGLKASKLIFSSARLQSDIKVKPGLKRFLPATLSGEFENAAVEPVPWQGSGDIAATTRSNCFVVIPPERELIACGEPIAVLLRP